MSLFMALRDGALFAVNVLSRNPSNLYCGILSFEFQQLWQYRNSLAFDSLPIRDLQSGISVAR
jgi:hypothetical protein